jgi:hypothetical protein
MNKVATTALTLLLMAGLALALTRWLTRLNDLDGDPLADR